MGLFSILTFPVSAPLAGGRWVLQTILDEAERRYYDPAAIRQELVALEQRFVAGQISEDQFAQREEELLERLLEAMERRRQPAKR